MLDLSTHKLNLSYPCDWCYKIVLFAHDDVEQIVKDILENKEHIVRYSKTSKNNRFKTYDISLVVKDEKERLDLYNKLNSHKNIKMVI